MTVLFRKHYRLSNLSDKTSVKRVYPTITYKYSNPAKLKEVSKDISTISGVTEGICYSVLKDFRSYLKKTLLAGRIVNIDGLGYFFLAAQSKGTDTAEKFTSNDITALRICFRANSDIRIVTSGATRSDGLVLKDVDRINSTEDISDEGGNAGGSSGADENENPLG
ncbi:DNA-binding protein [Bacteroides helcogenes]|uniref:DNA-binding protein n=1 Tax=Bacteroides helcogenes (strain ATCC 35417 / DSM 20613 / JCM 6297 / CCUG 15421 / P 36-108) TaxID=693979 RepID=E6SNC5_BACT6|nr:DNA-binding protein [Bacteroides helcogenes]ADV42718.1 DNA-binding protein [Bacteroides helcogenes P 36-108]MDY5239549.1 DNA-binding protein [Bacteroides helcogenes]